MALNLFRIETRLMRAEKNNQKPKQWADSWWCFVSWVAITSRDEGDLRTRRSIIKENQSNPTNILMMGYDGSYFEIGFMF